MITNTNAELELYNIDEEMIYWSHHSKNFDREQVLALLTERPENVEFGLEKHDQLQFG